MLPDNIIFSTNPTNDLSAFLSRATYSKLAVICDENTLKHCYPIIKTALGEHVTIEVKSGEEQKNLRTCEIIWSAMTTHALDRHAWVVVLGGGVLGDMAGFCAATYKRGINFILIPTTLLAQVDASIGGKLGIDFNHLKNHIGVFQQPVLTFLYSGFFKTLPLAELRSGFAEVIKHCLISNSLMWEKIRTNNLEGQNWDELLNHSVAFKASITQKDPKEQGLRKILNAGHTIGHAVESYFLKKGARILHGEAIAIGIIAEGFIANRKGYLQDNSLKDIYDYLIKIYGKIALTEDDIDECSMLTIQDKKNKADKILCVLLQKIGKAVWDIEIARDDVKKALHFYQSL